MADTVHYCIAADFVNYVAVQCDLPPASTTKDLYNEPYRDLSGQSGVLATLPGYVAFASEAITKTSLAGAVTPTTGLNALVSTADDVLHVPWRQDTPFKADYFVFTDGLGVKRGEFPIALYPSWSNQPPNTVVTA